MTMINVSVNGIDDNCSTSRCFNDNDNDRSRCFNDSPSDRRWHGSNGAEGAARGERSSIIVLLACFSSLPIFFFCFDLVFSWLLCFQLQVNVLLERHKELRRKKSANSFRREGVTQVIQKSNTLDLTRSLTPQRPQALNNSQQQTPNGDLPPIGLIEEKEENSTALWLEQEEVVLLCDMNEEEEEKDEDDFEEVEFLWSLWLKIEMINWSCDNTLKIHTSLQIKLDGFLFFLLKGYICTII